MGRIGVCAGVIGPRGRVAKVPEVGQTLVDKIGGAALIGESCGSDRPANNGRVGKERLWRHRDVDGVSVPGGDAGSLGTGIDGVEPDGPLKDILQSAQVTDLIQPQIIGPGNAAEVQKGVPLPVNKVVKIPGHNVKVYVPWALLNGRIVEHLHQVILTIILGRGGDVGVVGPGIKHHLPHITGTDAPLSRHRHGIGPILLKSMHLLHIGTSNDRPIAKIPGERDYPRGRTVEGKGGGKSSVTRQGIHTKGGIEKDPGKVDNRRIIHRHHLLGGAARRRVGDDQLDRVGRGGRVERVAVGSGS